MKILQENYIKFGVQLESFSIDEENKSCSNTSNEREIYF